MSEFNSKPIDIVVPWVNSEDPEWQKDFQYWSKKETGNTDRCRIRDFGQIKYLLRSIEQNCPWCRYVFLVVYSETQLPSWLNIDNPRLKIVYHKDFIPEEYLPTFNSFVMDMNLHRIKDLSENFIFCNDDMVFLSGVKETDFFKNNKPLFPFKYLIKGKFTLNNTKFDKTLKTNFDFLRKITDCNYKTNGMYHMPIPLNKSLYQFMWKKYEKEFKNSLIGSKFRQSKNLFNWLILFTSQVMNIAKDNKTIKRNFLDLDNKTTFDKILKTISGKNGCACLNDNEKVTNKYEKDIGKKLIKALEQKFKKSSFEK